jgi:hypothetical protein
MSEPFQNECRQLQTRIARSRRHVDGRLQRLTAPWRQLTAIRRGHRGLTAWALAALAAGYLLARWYDRGSPASARGHRRTRRTLGGQVDRWLRLVHVLIRRAQRPQGEPRESGDE